MNQELLCHPPAITRAYSITIQRGCLQTDVLSSHLEPWRFFRLALITDERVQSLYGKPLQMEQFSFPEGEHHKTQATKEALERQLFSRGFGRDTCILALGGGIVTDLAGYLAATYCRGVPLILLPTTLLAMIDASIGGKTGVNTPFGKNLIGCFYPPKKVLIDPLALHSLPKKELRSGIVEMIKHALIASTELFGFLEMHVEALLALEPDVLDALIVQNCQIKKDIVEQDEQEQGKRHLLNLGHTVGHALEHLTHYALSHGEAVALGLLVEAQLSCECGHLEKLAVARLHHLLHRFRIPLQLPSCISGEALFQTMILDKKTRAQHPRFVFLSRIGSALECGGAYCTTADKAHIVKAFNEVRRALCCH